MEKSLTYYLQNVTHRYVRRELSTTKQVVIICGTCASCLMMLQQMNMIVIADLIVIQVMLTVLSVMNPL